MATRKDGRQSGKGKSDRKPAAGREAPSRADARRKRPGGSGDKDGSAGKAPSAGKTPPAKAPAAEAAPAGAAQSGAGHSDAAQAGAAPGSAFPASVDRAPAAVPVAPASVSPADREVLRRLAARVAELAAREIEKDKAALWTAHNDLQKVRPLIFCDPEGAWREILPQESLECTGEVARGWEWHLRREIFWGEQMRDDRVIQPYFDVGHVAAVTGWGLEEKYTRTDSLGSHVWEAPVKDLGDLSLLRFPTVSLDQEATRRRLELAQEVLGDLLRVRLRGSWYWTLGLTWELIKLRGLEQMMIDMYDNPAGLHRLMAFLRDGTMAKINFLEAQGLYSLNNEGDYVGSGGFGWTRQLPAPGFDGGVRTRDLWCLAESQETVGVSPEMFEEFVFRYQLPLVERFGLVCYGCCEPVHGRWGVIRRIPNLRRVSVSPWADRATMAENLQDRYVYSLKPHPGMLAQERFHEDQVRADARDALDKTRCCHLELIMKDNHTIRGDPTRVTRWVRIVREEIERRC